MLVSPAVERILWILTAIIVPFIFYGILYLISFIKYINATSITTTETKIERLQKYDTRKPILYLRNFRTDGSKLITAKTYVPKTKIDMNLPPVDSQELHLNEENYIRRIVGTLGPLVSIGDPNPDDIGISRIQSDDKNWQRDALVQMVISRMIILRTESLATPGITWELDTVFNSFLDKTLFFVESTDSGLLRKIESRLAIKYPAQIKQKDFPKTLPYYFSIDPDGRKNYSYSIINSHLFIALSLQAHTKS